MRNYNPSDMEVALCLSYHIENPCTSEVNGITVSCRKHHLRLAKEVLHSLINPLAKEFLEEIIIQYDS